MNRTEPRQVAGSDAHPFIKLIKEAALLLLVSAGLGLGFNAIRRDSLPLVAKSDYRIVVPCPERLGDATALKAGDSRLTEKGTLLIDARDQEEFSKWHLDRAVNVPFDWLGPPLDAEIGEVARRATEQRAQRVVVYGDGDDPDTGRQWARLLVGAGLRNVYYVEGGAPALHGPRQGGNP